MGNKSKSKIEIVLSAQDTQLSAALKRSRNGLKDFGDSAVKEAARSKSAFAGLSSMKLAIGGIIGGAAAIYANQVRQIADEYTNLNSRLKLVTDGEQDLAVVRSGLYKISQETGTAYAGNADAYTKLARSINDLGGESEETLEITELLNKSLIINGSSTEMASSFMLQFAQAMGSGVLQGDEFRAMLESNGFFAAELSKALGTNIAGLREMSSNGELTAERLRSAFPKMTKTVTEEFSKISPTVERAMIMLENSFKRIVDESNQAGDGTGSISKSITNLAETIDRNRDGIVSFFSKLIDLGAWSTRQIAGIGTEVEVLGQVAAGNLDFSKYIKMTSVKEFEDWLKQNVQTLKETEKAAKDAGGEITKSSKQSTEAQKQITKEALGEMKKQYKSYADEVKKLQGSIADEQRSVAEELRDMSRSGMTDIQAWRDRKKEAQEFTAKAREAAKAAGDLFFKGNAAAGQETYQVALSYAEKAKDAYRELNTEVKQGDQVLISQKDALKAAVAGVQEAGNLKVKLMADYSTALSLAKEALNQQSGGQLDESIAKAKEGVDSLVQKVEDGKEKMRTAFSEIFQPPEDGDWGKVWKAMESGSSSASKAVTSTWNKTWDDFLASGSEDIESLEKKLQALAKDRYITVHINEVQGKAYGGMIQRLSYGGMVPGWSPHKRADNNMAALHGP